MFFFFVFLHWDFFKQAQYFFQAGAVFVLFGLIIFLAGGRRKPSGPQAPAEGGREGRGGKMEGGKR